MIILAISILVISIDQLTKFIVSNRLFPNQSIPIVKDILHFTFVQNRGAAFGLLMNRTPLFIILSLAAVILILASYRKTKVKNHSLQIALSLLLGGIIGNLIDRLRFGFVRDFIDFRIWPVFNVADLAISVGVSLLFLQVLLNPQRR